MIDPVPLAVDDGLLEAEGVDEELNQRAGVFGPQRRPDLRWWCVLRHGLSVAPGTGALAWRFRNSAASQAVGGAPASTRKSASRWAWS